MKYHSRAIDQALSSTIYPLTKTATTIFIVDRNPLFTLCALGALISEGDILISI